MAVLAALLGARRVCGGRRRCARANSLWGGNSYSLPFLALSPYTVLRAAPSPESGFSPSWSRNGSCLSPSWRQCLRLSVHCELSLYVPGAISMHPAKWLDCSTQPCQPNRMPATASCSQPNVVVTALCLHTLSCLGNKK